MQNLPTREEIERLFSYDPETGVFTWKVNTGVKKMVGKQAGLIIPGYHGGYRRLRINGKTYSAARVAWFLLRGRWPPENIDHINGDRGDNRIANLREATQAQNCLNRLGSSENGYKGVSPEVKNGKVYGYRARIAIKGKTVRLGIYRSAVEAAWHYDQAAKRYHGEFARLNFPVERDWLFV